MEAGWTTVRTGSWKRKPGAAVVAGGQQLEVAGSDAGGYARRWKQSSSGSKGGKRVKNSSSSSSSAGSGSRDSGTAATAMQTAMHGGGGAMRAGRVSLAAQQPVGLTFGAMDKCNAGQICRQNKIGQPK